LRGTIPARFPCGAVPSPNPLCRWRRKCCRPSRGPSDDRWRRKYRGCRSAPDPKTALRPVSPARAKAAQDGWAADVCLFHQMGEAHIGIVGEGIWRLETLMFADIQEGGSVGYFSPDWWAGFKRFSHPNIGFCNAGRRARFGRPVPANTPADADICGSFPPIPKYCARSFPAITLAPVDDFLHLGDPVPVVTYTRAPTASRLTLPAPTSSIESQ
jgi:hypothetical protein